MEFVKIKFKNFNTKEPPLIKLHDRFTVIQDVLDTSDIVSNDDIKDTVFMVNFTYYEEQIRSSYATDSTSIYKQLGLDIGRCSIKINDKRVRYSQTIIDYFDYKFGSLIASRVSMFCTQATMALPCEILYNIYGPKGLYIAELEDISTRYFKIKLYITNNHIVYIIKKNLRIIDENGNTKCHINVRLEFDIMKNDPLLVSFVQTSS
jgi:hypothetical protein